MASSEKGDQLEGEVAQAPDKRGLLIDFQSKIRKSIDPGNRNIKNFGEIDAETPDFIIEITTRKNLKKTGQLKRNQNNVFLNSYRKKGNFISSEYNCPSAEKKCRKIGCDSCE